MEKLYYTEKYQKEFTCEIVEIIEKDGQYNVVLDKSGFFPGGGGQPCDKGTLEGEAIVDVYEENGKQFHVLKKKPIKIHRVKGKINWDHRFDGMQQHLGQHVLSGCFFSLFNANTCGFHLGSEISTVDIVGFMDEEKLREAERMANEIIFNNIKVESFVPTKAELKKLNLRRDLPKTGEEIRVVKVGDLDLNACCGVHPENTIELQMIKIRRAEKHKGNTRIEFLAGGRAIKDSLKKDNFSRDICKYLSSNEEEAINGIKNLNNNLKEALDNNKKLSLEIAEYHIKEMIEKGIKVGETTIIKEVFNDGDLKYISKVASKLTETNSVIALLAVTNSEKANLIFASSKNIKTVNVGMVLKDAISLIDGKGGGSPHLAQGGGKNNNNLEVTLDYALKKVIKELEN